MTGMQPTIWELLDIAPTQDQSVVSEALAVQMTKHHDDPVKTQQLQDAWHAYRAEQTAQSDQLNALAFEPRPDLASDSTPEPTFESPPKNSTSTTEQTDENSVSSEFISHESNPESRTEERLIAESQPDTLQNRVEQFLNSMLDVISNSEQRQKESAWQEIITHPSLTDPTFVEAASFSVFHLIVNQANQSHLTLPDSIAKQLCALFTWQEQASSLKKYFSNEDVQTGLTLLYGDEWLTASSNEHPAQSGGSRHFHDRSTSSPKRNLAIYSAVGAVVMALLIGLSQVDFPDLGLADEEEPLVLNEPYWAEDLTVCNQAKQVVGDEAFTKCLNLAEQGRVYAQMRVAWLFFESEGEDHLQISYDWMSKAGNYDETSHLLSKIMLFVHGTSEEDKLKGYKGIVKQADSGFAGAEAYLALLYLLEQNLLEKTANPVWLLEKAHRNDAVYVGVLDLMRIYLNGLETRVDKNKAVAVMKKYADSFFPTSANNAAWVIATSRDLEVFSPSDAVKWAESVVQDPDYSNNFGFIDTLAAAYAADGQFELAIAEQKKAIALLKESKYSNEGDLEEFNSRLAAFSEGQRVTYFDMIVDASQLFPAMKQELENLFLDELKFATEQP